MKCSIQPKLQHPEYTDRVSKASGHPVEIICMDAHQLNSGNEVLTGPLDAVHLGEFAQILSRGLSDAVHSVTKPRSTRLGQLFVEEFDI